jgi:hypothetical protein
MPPIRHGAEAFFCMIQLNLNNNSDIIICTPLELLTNEPAYYYFEFTSRQTKNVIKVTLTDISNTNRYQKFIIDTESIFVNQKEGLWKYIIKPASLNNNTDPNTAICEEGLMYLVSNNTFEPTKYDDQSNQVKAYTK